MPKFLKLVSSHLIIDFFKFILKHFLDLLIFFFSIFIYGFMLTGLKFLRSYQK